MPQSTLNLLNDIFVQYPGDFLYFLLLIAISFVSLFMSLALIQHTDDVSYRRYPLALGGVCVGWVVMIAGAIYAQATPQATNAILPPLERAASTANLLLIAWAFLTAGHAETRTRSNRAVLILLSIVTLLYVITGVQWIDLHETAAFNLTRYGLLWTVVPLALAVMGGVWSLLQFNRIPDAPIKFVFFLMIGLGTALTLYQIATSTLLSNYAGIFRLSYILGLAIVGIIIYRAVIASLQPPPLEAIYEVTAETPSQPIEPPPLPSEATQPSPTARPALESRLSPIELQSVQLLKSVGMVLEGAVPTAIPDQIVRTALDMLRADVGAILRLQDANYADITAAYDKLMQKSLSGIALNLDDQYTLVNTIERRRQNTLYVDRNQEELDDIYTRLDIEQVGNVYFQPLTHNREVIAVLMIAFPYTKRELRAEEVELLKGFGIVSSSLLSLSYEAVNAARLAEDRLIQEMVEGLPDVPARTVTTADDAQDDIQASRDHIQQLSQQVDDLKRKLDHERNRIKMLLGDTEQGLSISQQITAIHDEQDGLRRERDRLAKRLQEAEAALRGAMANGGDNDAVLQDIMTTFRKEKENLEAEKKRLEQQLDELRAADKTVVAEDMQRLVNRMIEEKTRLETEHAQLQDKLGLIQSQLRELGLEDNISGFGQLISNLFHERAALQRRNHRLQAERESLLRERESLAEAMENTDKLAAMQSDIGNLATDREALVKQRDKLRHERDALREKLDAVKEHRARLLAKEAGFELERDEARQEQLRLREQLRQLADARSNIEHERDQLLAENRTLSHERDQLLAQVEGDPTRLQQVNAEGVGALRQMIDMLSLERNHLQRDLNQAKNQIAALQNQLQLHETTTVAQPNGVVYQPQQPDLLVGLVQELRTPMTSIGGYVDLLLGESAGILGEMQRKFLQRVAASISRLDSMIDSLVNITELDTGHYELRPRPVDMVNLMEDAITNATTQFREKGLAVDLDLDDHLPPIPVDKDSMKQVVGQLLSNAYLVSPPDSEIRVTVSQRPVRLYENQLPRPCLYVAVTDKGGGIEPEDLQRVFARKYKADNPLIEGVGDTGVGLSIAKALIESHQGRLWAETEASVGSTFAFAIPLDLNLQTEDS